jgi:hypothetical protein
LTHEILEKKKQYHNRWLLLERYLGISVTTKSHLAEDHSVKQMEDLGGIEITKMKQKLLGISDVANTL